MIFAKPNPQPYSIEYVKVEHLTVPHYLLDYLYSTKPSHQNEAQYVEHLLLKYIEERKPTDLYKDAAIYGNNVGELVDETIKTNLNTGAVFGVLRNVYIPKIFINQLRKLIPGGDKMHNLDLSYHVGSFVNGVINYFERNHFKNLM
jgi:hypothetical protein